MNFKQLKNEYKAKKKLLKERISQFRQLKEEDYFPELMFCVLTPQSNAKKCWDAVKQLQKLQNPSEKEVNFILKSRTRFHNNKTKYILEAQKAWNNLKTALKNSNIPELRNFLADNVKGYGLKEASHFLRNTGKSNNQTAILDRHILKNMKEIGIISEAKVKSRKDYLEKEQKFLKLAEKAKIPADELDLLLWSRENGEIFK
jgi:N-glycosylase/DNA lyase